MLMLPTLPPGFTALITGASGGIGGALVQALLADPRPGRVIAVGRCPPVMEDPRHEALVIDLTREEGHRELAERMEGAPLHLLFNAIGTLHDDSLGIQPEKKLDDLDPASLTQLFHINAVVPALLLRSLQPNLKGKHAALVASLSARVGSIGDNRLGGWYAYRASKAAHNMLMRTAAIELKRLNPRLAVVCLHPGTTDTDLSRPFQARVPAEQLLSASFAASRLLTVLGECGPESSGSFLDWAGKPVPW